MAVNKGAAALESLDATQEGKESASFTKFKTGTALKVLVKGAQDLASFHSYGIFGKVYSFTPDPPPERNAKGFIVEGTETPWDLAAKYHQDRANQARTAGDTSTEDDEKESARLYRGKERYMMGFFDLTEGKDIVVDVSKAQAQAIHATIKEYEEEIAAGDLAFKLSKSGSGTSTSVSLSPIVNVKKGLTAEEQAAFEAEKGKPFNDTLFDSILYEANHAEQVENLVKAGFDVGKIGLTASQEEASEYDVEDSEDHPF
ncbi:hypothetical protein MM326_13865 [Alkalihalobacillus sp. LMS6]|jgi:hypothetical protein|uniref:hypothetical protein n=1 Tax=Alkalihalobacillus sp. LMS6 TaxID=2924034 RepID=UPI0020D0C96B|nr:hypothetical protein [Alkalihalobacillus sp. LMS6]UTR05189.1 hypothetical protein MM326_13865 [Alkalihalobacillus sp. LMS6]